MTKVARMIAEFFNGLNCDVSAKTLTSYLNTLVKQAGVSRINNLIKLFNSDRRNFWNNLQGPLCNTIVVDSLSLNRRRCGCHQGVRQASEVFVSCRDERLPTYPRLRSDLSLPVIFTMVTALVLVRSWPSV